MNARVILAAGAVAVAIAASGCGGGRAREAGLALGVQSAGFPPEQQVAGPTQLRIVVVNDDDRTAPEIAVTIDSFAAAVSDSGLQGASRPIWIVDQGPGGGTAGDPRTWSTGPLAPGATRTFAWAVTPVRPGTYTVGYRVSAGADATVAGGRGSAGSFRVTIRSTAADTRVDPRTGAVVVRPRPG